MRLKFVQYERAGLKIRRYDELKGSDMTRYVPSTEQLVVEVYARDLQRSMEFYQAFHYRTASGSKLNVLGIGYS